MTIQDEVVSELYCLDLKYGGKELTLGDISQLLELLTDYGDFSERPELRRVEETIYNIFWTRQKEAQDEAHINARLRDSSTPNFPYFWDN